MKLAHKVGPGSVVCLSALWLLAGCEKPAAGPESATTRPAPTPAEVEAAREAVKPALQPVRTAPSAGGSAELPANHPPIESTGPSAARPTAGASRQESSPIHLDAPSRWTAEPPAGPSRILQYLIPPTVEGERPTRLVVTVFPNTGVMAEAGPNIERWKRSFKTADGQPLADSDVAREDKTINGHPSTTVRMQGVSGGSTMAVNAPSSAAEMRLVATMVTHENHVYFLKLEGPIAAVKAAESEFDQLLNTLRFE